MRVFSAVINDIKKFSNTMKSFFDSWAHGTMLHRFIGLIIIIVLVIDYLEYVDYSIKSVASVNSKIYSVSNKKKHNIIKLKKRNTVPSPGKNSKRDAAEKKNPDDIWKNPTGGAYPDIKNLDKKNIYLKVDTSLQTVTVYNGSEVLYTMIASTGIGNLTPKGTYKITDRGTHFYNPKERLGGDYWVGFKQSKYLFHTVPTGRRFGTYIKSEARKLGHKASNGCVRLSVPDAKWIYVNIPQGVKVKII